MILLVSHRYRYMLQTFQKSGCMSLDKLFKTLHSDEFSGMLYTTHPASFGSKNMPIEDTFVKTAKGIRMDKGPYLQDLGRYYMQSYYMHKPYKDFFRFAVVRNTYDRVISMYFNRFLGVGEPSTTIPLKSKPLMLDYTQRELPFPMRATWELNFAETFNNFLKYLIYNNCNDSGDWHYRKQDIYDPSQFKIDKYINLDKINEVLPELYETKFSISKDKVKKILKKKINALPKNNYDIDIKLDEYDFKNDALNLDICKNGIPQKELMLTDKSINMIKKLYKEEIDYHKFKVN
tara:strand:+ start:127 stop:999 length:873 start_codon:yes stop_codon:yes gene_type:complete